MPTPVVGPTNAYFSQPLLRGRVQVKVRLKSDIISRMLFTGGASLNRLPLCLSFLLILLSFAAMAQTPAADKITPQGAEYFESKIRPVLAKSCYPCHSSTAKATMGGLSLETRDSVLKGGTSGPALMPGDPAKSALVKAIRYEGRKMPPSAQLPASVIADIEKWVEMGAPDPRVTTASNWKPTTIDIEKGRKYWAFQAPQKPAVPAVTNAKWSSQPIDRLLLARMEQKQVTPVADADRATWLRRVTFDLTGLPPTPDELDTYLKDTGKKADAKVVDRMLASERFGERWGRHWLDVARYAESVGRGRNYAFPFAWRYRDYVIDSMNRDKPFDQFIKEQLAGDLLPAADAKQRNEQLIATGFLSLGSHDLIEQNPQTFRMDVIDEQIHATTRAFLATTVGCARCHDHKFDPIPTTDYYAMAGIFKSTEMLSGLQRRPRDNFSYFNMDLLAKMSYGPGEQAPEHLKTAEDREKWNELQAKLKDLLAVGPKGGGPAGKKKPVAVGNKLRQETRPILDEIDKYPLPMDLAMAVREAKQIDDCEVYIRGDAKDLGPKVPRGFVQVESLPGEKLEIPNGESGRLQLAQWIARRENPLTARVAVNRIWEHLFGRGIVPTVDNFGKMGEQPSNQELIDYLAVRFVEQGWSTKKMIREIVLTRAYHLSSVNNAGDAKIDPDNKLFWRMNRQRLEVEAIRDSLLMLGGKLDLQRPEASPVLGYKRGIDIGRAKGRGMAMGDFAFETDKRTIYVPIVRNNLSPMFEVFDFPEPSETKGRRDVTTVPTQALFMMNSPFVMAQAKNAAKRLLDLALASDDARIRRVYLEALGRSPTAVEVKKSSDYIQSLSETPAVDAWGRFYQALFQSAEFRYRS